MSSLIIFGHDYTKGRKNAYLKSSLVSLKDNKHLKDIIFYEVQPETMKYDFFTIQKIIERNDITSILFADDTIYSYNVLRYIDEKVLEKLNIVFYIFDNLKNQLKGLMKIEEILIGQKVRFLSPSNAQFDLYEQCLMGQNDIKLVPYPLVGASDLDDWEHREKQRDKYGFNEESIVVLCTGESTSPSQLANVFKAFEAAAKKNKDLYLIVSNKMEFSDDWDDTLRENVKFFAGLDSSIRSRILNLGSLQEEHILELVKMSDCLINLNTSKDCICDIYLDMAMSLGLPAILTSWGGNKDYRKLNQVELIQVEYAKNEFSISMNHLINLLEQTIPLEKTKRLKNSLRIKWSFNGDPVKKLADMLDKNILLRYVGISETFKKILKKKKLALKDEKALYSVIYE